MAGDWEWADGAGFAGGVFGFWRECRAGGATHGAAAAFGRGGAFVWAAGGVGGSRAGGWRDAGGGGCSGAGGCARDGRSGHDGGFGRRPGAGVFRACPRTRPGGGELPGADIGRHIAPDVRHRRPGRRAWVCAGAEGELMHLQSRWTLSLVLRL